MRTGTEVDAPCRGGRSRRRTASVLGALSVTLLVALTARAWAVDKNGVSPQAIALPTGPASVHGLGESFQPQLNTGSGSYTVKLELPRGTAGFTPELSLVYDTGSPDGCAGLGWKISGAASVVRNTDCGVPYYVDGPNGEDDDLDGVVDNPLEVDPVSGVDGEELVQLADGSYRAENESAFLRYERRGDGGWDVRSKGGLRREFGTRPEARVQDSAGRVFRWLLERSVDPNGNVIEYEYTTDAASPGQKYCRSIRWGQPPDAFYEVVLSYEAGRPDVFSDYRAGFEVRTALRLARLDVVAQGVPPSPGALTGDLNGDGRPDALVRRYTLDYEPAAPVSLLRAITQLGKDGVTALPPLTFEYTTWSPPDNVAASVIASSGEPPVGLDSESVELIDLNGDALPDLLDTSGSSHRISTNLGVVDGVLRWSSARPVLLEREDGMTEPAPSIDVASSLVHLGDGTSDGLADLLVKVSATRFECYDNSSRNTWLSPRAPLRRTDTWPQWPFDGAEGGKSRSMDCDYNRCNDVLYTGTSSYRLWMLLPGGQYSREVSLPPLTCDGQTFTFDAPGARIADMNGDRLQDIVWVQSSRVVYWPSRGRGSFDAPIVLGLGLQLLPDDVGRTGFNDIDADGLVDVTVVRPTGRPQDLLYWINRFQAGLEGPRAVTGLPALRDGDELRWADMNGNGSVDILISNGARTPGQRILVIDLAPEKPYLLSRIDNGLGLVVTMDYETSVEQMVRASQDGSSWASAVQMTVPVLRRVTEGDGHGNLHVRELTYRDPYYDSVKQEFRGFRAAEERELGDATAPTKVMRHEFDTGDVASCLKGRPVVVEALDDAGGVFTRTESVWSHRVLASGADGRDVCYAFNERTDDLVRERGDTAVLLRVDSEFDDFGNEIASRSHGVLAVAGDEVFVEREFELRPDEWRMDLVSRETTTDASLRRVAEDRFTYDERGNLARRESWLDTEDRLIPVLRNGHDEFGNVVEVMDAVGNRRTFAHDALLHAHVVSETVHLEARDLVFTAGHDLGLGVVASSVDPAGAETRYTYDALARLVDIARPLGAGKSFEYRLGRPVSTVVTRTREDAFGGTFDSYAFFDGYGRKLGEKLEAEDGLWRSVDAVAYSSRMLEGRRWLPHAAANELYEAPAASEDFVEMAYDELGRVVRRTQPDGAFSSTVYEPLVSHQADENDTAGAAAPRTLRTDGLGRLVEVVERNAGEELRTTYEWSTLSDLVRVRDAQGNEKALSYDSLRRILRVDDPDRGTRLYEYDDAGHNIRTEDAKGQVTLFTYDRASRLATVNYLDRGGGADPVDVIYTYDTPSVDLDLGDGTRGMAAFTAGRLASVADLSGEEHLSYDARGNVVRDTKRVADPRLSILVSYTTSFEYDLMDRVVGLTYPDGDRLRYVYNEASFPERIDGGPGGRVIVEDFDYDATGKMTRVAGGNGVVSTYTYDERDRIERLLCASPTSGELIHYAYAYDPFSNLVSATDERSVEEVPASSPRRNTQHFSYDDLHRLTRVRYARRGEPGANLGQVDYAYDAIGNMVSRTVPDVGENGHFLEGAAVHLGAMRYDGGTFDRGGRLPGDPPGPHCFTATTSGIRYAYDANGNVTRIGDAALEWDFEDRLVRYEGAGTVAEYTYDHEDRRIVKRVTEGRSTESTIYVSSHFEVRPGRSPTKFVFTGGLRLARVSGTLDPSRPRVQRLWLAAGWNAITVAVETGRTVGELFGDAIVYSTAGGRYEPLDPSREVPVGQVVWVLVDEPQVVAAIGDYAPATAPVSLAAGGAFFGWARLEPFVPSVHLSEESALHVYDAPGGRWLARRRALPSFLSDLGDTLGAAGAFWLRSAGAVTVEPAAALEHDVLFYHADHLQMTCAITDLAGRLVEETIHFPFGETRSAHRPTWFDSDYDFAGKERDRESGLHAFGRRFYAAATARFLSPDPLYTQPEFLGETKRRQLLENPQMLNVLAYALNNPLRYHDADGLDNAAQDGGAGTEVSHRFTTEDLKRVHAMYQKRHSGCMTAMYHGLAALYGWSDKERKAFHRRVFKYAAKKEKENNVDRIMEVMQKDGLADAGVTVKHLGKGQYDASLEETVLAMAKEEGGIHFFGLSANNAYHTIVLAVGKNKDTDEWQVYWLDQTVSGFNKNVTGELDERVQDSWVKSDVRGSEDMKVWHLKPPASEEE